MVSARVPIELYVALEIRAEREGRSVSNLIVALMRAGLQVIQAIEFEPKQGETLPAVFPDYPEPAATVRDRPHVAIARANPRPGHDKATCRLRHCGMCAVT